MPRHLPITASRPSSIETLCFRATDSRGEVSARLLVPAAAKVLYVMAHGAGAGMDHPFLESVAHRLAESKIATLRYQFPYMEAGGRRPDPPAVLVTTVCSAVARAAEVGLPMIAGGKSLGGRMTAYAAADTGLPGVHGLAFLGFPLHPPGRDGTQRWSPMTGVRLPMLFLQGDRDRLANLELLRPVVQKLEPSARLHVVKDGDHSFKVRKRSGRSDEEVLEEIADRVSKWALALVSSQSPRNDARLGDEP